MGSHGTRPWYRIVVPCLLLAPIALMAQTPSRDDPLTFRTGTTYVEVDVTVTDRSGDFVRDLTRDDDGSDRRSRRVPAVGPSGGRLSGGRHEQIGASWVVTYYPGVVSPSEASIVQVRPDTETPGVNVRWDGA